MRRLWLVIPAAVTVVLYWPTLFGGRLSDDYLLSYLLDHGAAGTRVAWHEVLADFTRPWLGLEGGALYRPVMSLSYGIDAMLGGGDAFVFHATNVLCQLIAATCVAWLGAAIAARHSRPATAAAFGTVAGLWFAVHPASLEAVAWISGRVSSLETAWHLLCLVSFAMFLRSRTLRAYACAIGFALLALGTKESAVVLPVSLVAVDLLVTERPKLRELAARHAPFAGLVVAYLVLRVAVLGSVAGSPLRETAGLTLAGHATDLLAKLAALSGGFEIGPASYVCGAALAVAIALGGARPALVAAVWLAILLVPSYPVRLGASFGGSRVLHCASAGLAIGALAVFARVSERHARLSVLLLAVAAFVQPLAWRATFIERRTAWQAAWRHVGVLDRALNRLAKTATPGKPVAILSAPAEENGVPVLNPNAVFPLLERPFHYTDSPLIGLQFVVTRIPDQAELFMDASPLRAVLETGAPLLTWNASGPWFDRIDPPKLEPRLQRTPRGWRLASRTSPYSIEAIEVTTSEPCQGGRLVTLPRSAGHPDWTSVPFANGIPHGTGTRFVIDLSHSIPFASHALGAGVTGIEVEAPAGVASLRLVRRLPEIDRGDRLHGAAVALGQEGARLEAPARPAGCTLRMVLLGPHAGHAFAVAAESPVVFPDNVRVDLRRVMRVYRQKLFWFYFEARAEAGRAIAGARSRLDWFVLEVPHGG